MPRQLQRSYLAAGLSGLLFLAPAAFAADAPVRCAAPDALRSEVKECAGNFAYAKAAKACLDRFTQTVDAAQAVLAKSLAAYANAGAQKETEANAKAGYVKAMSSLDQLAELGAALQRQVKGYKLEVAFPEDFESATSSGLSAEVFLRNFPCYTDTQELLDQNVEIFAARIEQLKLTKQIAETMSAKAGGREQKLTAEEVQAKLNAAGKAAAGAPTAKAPAKKNGASTITGVEQDKKKQKK